jgi:hypothetical protein
MKPLFTIPVTGGELVGINKDDADKIKTRGKDRKGMCIGTPYDVTEKQATEWGFESAKSLRISILEILLNDKMYSIVPNNILLILVKK